MIFCMGEAFGSTLTHNKMKVDPCARSFKHIVNHADSENFVMSYFFDY